MAKKTAKKTAKETVKQTATADGKKTITDDILPEIPDVLATKTKAYVKALEKSKKATSDEKKLRDECLDLMTEHGIPYVEIDDKNCLALNMPDAQLKKIKKDDLYKYLEKLEVTDGADPQEGSDKK